MAGAIAYPVRTPQWVLTYSGANITADISAMVLEITYTDHVSHVSDEVEVRLEDRDKRWQGPWYPAQGDIATPQIGYAGEALMPCGDFQVDELELDGPPDVFHLKCIGAGITPSLRTANHAGYENQTLPQIAAAIAAKHGLTVVGAPQIANVSFQRVTQRHETDLAFLHRIANRFNYDFSVRGSQLIFYSRTILESQSPVYTIQRRNVVKFTFKDRTHQIFKAASVSYQDPATKQLITQSATADAPTGDTLKIQARAETAQSASAQAQAALHSHNMLRTTGRLMLRGTTALVAGNNCAVSGFGVSDGTYFIESTKHRLERSGGYTTEIEVRRVS